MVAEGTQYFQWWWIGTFPGLAIFTVVLAFNFLGDSLRDVFDPRTARRTEESAVSVLAVEGLRVRLPTPAGEVTVVDGVDYEVQPAEVFGIAGESGSGKTISMLALLGLLPEGAVVEGTARFGDADLLSLPRRRLQAISGRDIAMVFQDPYYVAAPDALDRPPADRARATSPRPRPTRRRGAGGRAARRRPHPGPARRRSARYPHQFSGGMRQRIAIAIALACRPRLLIADEPTTALDVTVQAGILRLLDRLRREHELAVVLITHDLGVLSSIADRVSIFYAGRVVESGGREDILQRPRHPYTRALLDALPHPEASKERDLVAIAGSPPTPGRFPPGCSFHPRCGYTQEQCRVEPPALVPVGDRTLACFVDPFATMSALELADVVVDYHGRGGRVRAVAGASLAVERGQIVGLVGESGCGKSTLARAAVGLVPTAGGSVSFEGRTVTPLAPARAADGARPAAARLPEPVLVPQPAADDRPPARRRDRRLRPPRARSAELLELVGLPPNAVRRYPHEFSGGQRQRIAIARALAADPSVIVLDEPLASLDASAQAQLANLLGRLCPRPGRRAAADLARPGDRPSRRRHGLA